MSVCDDQFEDMSHRNYPLIGLEMLKTTTQSLDGTWRLNTCCCSERYSPVCGTDGGAKHRRMRGGAVRREKVYKQTSSPLEPARPAPR